MARSTELCRTELDDVLEAYGPAFIINHVATRLIEASEGCASEARTQWLRTIAANLFQCSEAHNNPPKVEA